MVKNLLAKCRRCKFQPWIGGILWRKKWQPTSVFLPGESYGQRSLLDYNPSGAKSQTGLSDLTLHFIYIYFFHNAYYIYTLYNMLYMLCINV